MNEQLSRLTNTLVEMSGIYGFTEFREFYDQVLENSPHTRGLYYTPALGPNKFKLYNPNNRLFMEARWDNDSGIKLPSYIKPQIDPSVLNVNNYDERLLEELVRGRIRALKDSPDFKGIRESPDFENLEQYVFGYENPFNNADIAIQFKISKPTYSPKGQILLYSNISDWLHRELMTFLVTHGQPQELAVLGIVRTHRYKGKEGFIIESKRGPINFINRSYDPKEALNQMVLAKVDKEEKEKGRYRIVTPIAVGEDSIIEHLLRHPLLEPHVNLFVTYPRSWSTRDILRKFYHRKELKLKERA